MNCISCFGSMFQSRIVLFVRLQYGCLTLSIPFLSQVRASCWNFPTICHTRVKFYLQCNCMEGAKLKPSAKIAHSWIYISVLFLLWLCLGPITLQNDGIRSLTRELTQFISSTLFLGLLFTGHLEGFYSLLLFLVTSIRENSDGGIFGAYSVVSTRLINEWIALDAPGKATIGVCVISESNYKKVKLNTLGPFKCSWNRRGCDWYFHFKWKKWKTLNRYAHLHLDE